MSLGPSDHERPEDKPSEVIRKMQVFAAASFNKFAARPSNFLFYFFLSLAMGALFCGKELPWQYWGLLALLGAIDFLASLKLEESDKEKK